MIIAAISDLEQVGSDPEPFLDMIKKAKKTDLFLMAGDIYEYRSPEIYGLILDFLKLAKWECPIVAIFGNREFDEDKDEIRKVCKKRVTFLEEKSIELNIGNKKVGIVGSEGSLDIPTWWQYKNLPNIKKNYDERREKVRELLKKLKSDVRILLTHYSSTYKTLKGEDQRIYGGLGSNKYEDVLRETRPTFAVHGHAEYGIPLAFVSSIPVFNVAFNVNRKIVEIDPDKLPKTGLHKFVK